MTKPIALLDLGAQLSRYRDRALAAMTRVVDASEFIMGPEVARFEAALAGYVDVPYAVSMSSGTDALLAALMALDVGKDDEVVTTTFSFFATAGVIARLGAKPVFVDIDPGTFNATGAALQAALTPRTRALLPVHLFGQMTDLGDLWSSSPVPIIEDAAQSLGARLHGKPTGHFGSMAAVSFFPSKNLGGFGDGGAILTRDERLAERLSILRVHGSKPKYHHHLVGGNFRLDTIQAAVLEIKLEFLEEWSTGRARNAALYDQLFAESGLIDRGLVKTPTKNAGSNHVYNQYVLRVENRDELQKFMSSRGVGTAVYYPIPLHLQQCFSYLGYKDGDFPYAEAACKEVLAIPVYPELESDSVRRVVDEISAFYRL